MLDDLPATEHGMATLVADPLSVGGMVDVTLEVCIRANEVHARYYGHDFVGDNRKVKRQRTAVASAMASISTGRR